MQDQENQASPNPEEVQQAAQAQQQAPQQQSPFEPAANPSLEEQLAATEAKLAEMHDAFMRAKAEGDNIRRRAQEDVAKAHKFAVESFAEALLPVKDSLEMALKVETPSVESLKEGVEMTLKQLTSAFERNKLLEVVPAAGDKLDPNRHQAVAMVPAEQEANTVVAVLQKGYTIADRLLRPAIVTAAQPK
ncbi:nucleotide exchange factor GrpE [Pseudoduganella umbonata]|uniref:Protein GrpE n=1 Tax=Pseudoduganella umbonata TaxID=864828 RepID=A0A4P8HQI8_9BURK|nr:nucleotide exchange factor GrpE [Pseudoduganella umbonata]MBB3220410.1 molecular chaperone GrpE [Pseudoduganella umbonata]QCP12059.1 nucleotide exchange factor GrpE [Pseudoduganella umbonata]